MNRLSTGTIVAAIIALFLFGPLIGLAVLIAAIYFNRGSLFTNPKQRLDLDNTQAQSLAHLVAWVLYRTGKNSPTNIERAVNSYVAHVGQYFPQTDPWPFANQIKENAINGTIDEALACSQLRNTFLLPAARINQGDFLGTLATIYEHAAGIQEIFNDRFLVEFRNIGIAIGAQVQLVTLILFRFQMKAGAAGFSSAGFGGNYSGGYSYGGSSRGGYQDYDPRSSSEYKKALDVLGLNDDCSEDDLRKKRRVLLRQWHPDKAPDGQEKLYEQKAQEINNAVSVVAEVKGFKIR